MDRSREAEGGEITVRSLKSWVRSVPVTDVSDIGRVLKRILDGHAEAANTVLYIAGDTITYGQLVDIMERVSGREVLRKVWSLDHLQNQLERNPGDLVNRYRVALAGEGVYWPMEKTVNHRLGMKMMGVEPYAKKLLSVHK